MRRAAVLLLGLVVIGALASAQELYAFYYSRSPGRDMELNLMNTTSSQVQYEIRAYDAWGNQVWETTGDLAPKDAAFYLLSEQIPEDASHWGVLTVVATERLVIAPEYYVNGQPMAFDLVISSVSPVQEGSAYQLTLYHSEVTESGTGLVILNPWDQEVSGRLGIYRSDGSILGTTSFTLKPHESTFLNLVLLVGQGTRNWGLVEVATNDRSIVAAIIRVVGGAMQVKNVTQAQLVAAISPTEQPAPEVETPPRKED